MMGIEKNDVLLIGSNGSQDRNGFYRGLEAQIGSLGKRLYFPNVSEIEDRGVLVDRVLADVGSDSFDFGFVFQDLVESQIPITAFYFDGDDIRESKLKTFESSGINVLNFDGEIEGLDKIAAVVKNEGLHNDLFTTSDVSKIFRTSPITVKSWLRKGLMEGFRVPMSEDRRFTLQNINDFRMRFEIPEDSRYLRTGEASKLYLVSTKEVTGLYEGGKVKGFLLPDSRDRRIAYTSFVGVMKDNSIPKRTQYNSNSS